MECDKDKKIADLNKRLTDREHDIQVVTEIAERLMSQNKELKSEMDAREDGFIQQAREIAKVHEIVQAELAAKKQELFNYVQDAEERDRCNTEALAEANTKAKQAVETLEKRCEALEKENDSLKSKLENKTDADVSATSQLSMLKQQLEAMERDHIQEIDLLNDELNRVKTLLEETQEQAVKDQSKCASFKDKNAELSSEVDRLSRKMHDLENLPSKFEQERQKTSVLSVALNEANRTIKELQECLESNTASASDFCTTQTADPNSLWSELDDEKRRIEKGYTELSKKHEELTEQQKKAEEERSTLKRHIQRLKREALQPSTAPSSSSSEGRALAEANTMISKLQSEIRRLHDRPGESYGHNESTASYEQLRYLRLDNDRLRKDLESQNNSILLDKERLVKAERSLSDTEHKLMELIKVNKALTFDLQQAAEKIENLSSSASSFSHENVPTSILLETLSKRGINVDSILLGMSAVKPRTPESTPCNLSNDDEENGDNMSQAKTVPKTESRPPVQQANVSHGQHRSRAKNNDECATQ